MSTNIVTKNESLATQSALRVLPEAEALLTVHEVAEFLRVPVSWVYEDATARDGAVAAPEDREVSTLSHARD